MDLDLRKVRYFTAVAEQLHFGRAAESLHIAQPVLSRQIRALEKDLDARLFERDSHRVTLTAAGRQLLDDARHLLANADATRRRVLRAARGTRRLVVGFRAGVVVTGAVRAFGVAHPDVEVKARRVEWDD
jgi:DNA-binding transcriptional LysR family regulator